MTFDPKELAAKASTEAKSSRGKKLNPDDQAAAVPETTTPPSENQESGPSTETAAGALPGDGAPQEGDGSDPAATPPPGAGAAQDPAKSATAILKLPIHACIKNYTSTRLDLRLTRRQAAAVKVLWSSLSELHERFDGGRSHNPEGTVVEGPNDGLRWFLDRLADSIEGETGKRLEHDFGLEFAY
ncbi:MAG: hypothetical protein AB7G28_22705 [Pirellulales bacterium]